MNRRKKIRNYTTIVAIAVLIIISFVPTVIKDIDTENWLWAYIVVAILGTAAVTWVVVYPYYRPIDPPSIPHTVGKDERTIIVDNYKEDLITSFVVYFTGSIFIISTVLTLVLLFAREYVASLFTGALSLLICLEIYMFGFLKIWTEESSLKIKMGFFKESLKLSEITTARSIAIKPLREYLGWGKTTGPDGAISYITGLKTGVRIEMQNGKKYVVSTKQPQLLVEIIMGSANSITND